MTANIAVVGAGNLARTRAKAFLDTGRARICAVASRHTETAEKMGREVGCDACFDDYRRILETHPDAVLVEVPHGAQDAVTLWALEQGLHVLVGGCLAGSPETADRVVALANERGLIVEAGYEARYAADWEMVKDAVDSGTLGRIIAARSIALWDGDPESWYYSEHASGGMPLTHMTYCFVAPLRYLFGDPLRVSAFANRIKETDPDRIEQETSVANLVFPDDILYSMLASFVKPPGLPSWSVHIVGTEGAAEIEPLEGNVVIHTRDDTQRHALPDAPDSAFPAQAHAFLDALDGNTGPLRCAAHDTAADIHIAAAIAESCRNGGKSVELT